MLLIDGVKYKLWVPKTEDDLERIVREHAKDIFGNDSLYLDLKKGLKSKAGIGSIPDGYVITFEEKPRWYVVEIELSSHPLYEHIVPQITKFINGITSPHSQQMLIDAVYEEIGKDDVLKSRIRKKIGSEEIHKFLSSLISNPPVITIIIEEKTSELEEVCHSLPGEKRIVEFTTFEREGVGLGVHAHLFEPVVKVSPPPPPPPLIVPPPPDKLPVSEGDWVSKGTRFPGGTEFRASYKGQTYYGKVESGALVVDGKGFHSPSAAANAITGKSANGWTFWECRFPGKSSWQMIKSLRK